MSRDYKTAIIGKALGAGDRSMFDALVQDELDADPKLDGPAAVGKVMAKYPALYRAYTSAVARGAPVAKAADVEREPATPTALRDLIREMVRPRAEVIKRQEGLDDLTAVAEVFRRDPLLYNAYRAKASIRTGLPAEE